MTDWGQEHRDQTDYLWRQLDALRAGPRSRWRRYRLLEYVCRGCGNAPFLEVMELDPYPVVVTRSERLDGQPGGELAMLPLGPEAQGEISAICKCQNRLMPLKMISTDVIAGTRIRKFDAARRD